MARRYTTRTNSRNSNRLAFFNARKEEAAEVRELLSDPQPHRPRTLEGNPSGVVVNAGSHSRMGTLMHPQSARDIPLPHNREDVEAKRTKDGERFGKSITNYPKYL